MSLPGWPRPSSPYHAGERAIHDRLGIGERVERFGRNVIRAALPDQHRELFEELPFVVVGSLDEHGQPWASIVAGPPGFVRSPDARTLVVGAALDPLAPLTTRVRIGAPIGLLGIELPTRRRNRANGRVRSVDAHGFTVAIEQSFGNCPKYIQARAIGYAPGIVAEPPSTEAARLSDAARSIVAAADTFFIATSAVRVGSDDPTLGVDVSHRGGRPGFVAIEDDDGGTQLSFPDYVGNFAFNTLGNLVVDRRASLVFVDFSGGTTLELAGVAEIVWDGPELAAVAGAQRLVRFRVERGLLRRHGVPLVASAAELAPELSQL
ncbi:MAG: pyridoxamine 5'-phosphate oxidase family protein [Deltaproteobacteria bacterium]|nr:pyridoxamine 5'-phosphate oxidase family protein [Nannocystaceae bacterium]